MGKITRILTDLSMDAVPLTSDERKIADVIDRGDFVSLPLVERLKYQKQARESVRKRKVLKRL
ncbi:MAG: hypothetical protein HYT22_01850 [Candidatus Niyogibacteria bacterium]|nr:hypothetical protein [Candidatus Niyogibacteria bacterium]